jgi:hypothetical protein
MSNEIIYNESDNEFTPIDYLKSLDLEHFLNCLSTKEILLENHEYNYESILENKLKQIYSRYNIAFRDESLFSKDYENNQQNSFAFLIYNFIAVKYDLNIFYDNHHLAKDLFKLSQ